jgi:hypothetical protein
MGFSHSRWTGKKAHLAAAIRRLKWRCRNLHFYVAHPQEIGSVEGVRPTRQLQLAQAQMPPL